jgi:hypothetical protein
LPCEGWLRFLVGQKRCSSSLVILKSHPMLPVYFCHVPFMKIKYRSDLEADRKKSEVSPCISANFEWPTFSNMNILYMRTQILCHRIEKKILVGQKRSSSSLVILKSHVVARVFLPCVPFMKISTSCLLNSKNLHDGKNINQSNCKKQTHLNLFRISEILKRICLPTYFLHWLGSNWKWRTIN